MIVMPNARPSSTSNKGMICLIAKSWNIFSLPASLRLTGNHSVYIISTAIANGSKAKFYNEDLPALEDVSNSLPVSETPDGQFDFAEIS